MSRNYKIHDQTDLHYLTYATVDWVDLLTRPDYKDIIVESLRHCQREKGLDLFAWCIMTNHVHLIARAKAGCQLQDIMRDHKKFTARQIVDHMRTNTGESRLEWMIPLLTGPPDRIRFWQPGLHPIWLRTPAVIDRKVDYIHQNPVKAGLVFEAHHYPYSSAVALSGGPAVLKLEPL